MIYLDNAYLERLKETFDSFESAKDEVLNLSRNIIKHSKSTIYSLLRDDWKSAESETIKMKEELSKLDSRIQKYPRLAYLANGPNQEYVEAMVLYSFLKEKRVPTHIELNVTEEAFILGLADASGELLRKSVEEMIKGDITFAKTAKEFMEELYRSLLEMNFRNYELRKKVDFVSNTLNRLVEYIFEKT